MNKTTALVRHDVETERGTLSVRRRPEADPAALPLILVHGWPETSYTWTHVAEQLPDIPIIAPDLRGLGDSPRTPELAAYSKDALALDVIAVADALGAERFAVFGHDWGGIVAQEVALAAPERVAGLGISNIAVINNLATNRAIAQTSTNRFMWYQHFLHTELPEVLIPGNDAAWVGHFLRAWRTEGFPDDVLAEAVRCHQIEGTARSTANYYRSYAMDVKRWAQLGSHRFPMPSVYVYGAHDVVITPDYLDGLESCFDNVELVRIPAGHFVQDEQPEAVAAAVASWLERIQ